jgi:Fe-S cluster assembly protein SufD
MMGAGTNMAVDRLVAEFADRPKGSAWLGELRDAGLARFSKLGFPTTRHEDWRFTNVKPLTELPFKLDVDGPVDGLNGALFTGLEGPQLVFVNGLFSDELSVVGDLPEGVMVGSVAAALTEDDAKLEGCLSRQVRNGGDAFAALNTAFFTDGALVWVPEGVAVEAPIRIYFVTTATADGATANLRNLIVVGANSSVTVIESWTGGGAAYFNNAITELVVGDNASVEHVKFQDEGAAAFHVAGLHATLGRDCRAAHHSIALGGRLARNNIHAWLDGEGLECVLNGLYLTENEQLIDHHMVVEHTRPHGESHEYFNGILDDASRGVFHGRIHVHRGADKTDAKQTNKNLLLSDRAQVDTKPQLEIYADDVKCTHGATVGQMPPEQIFYLRTRGLSEANAWRMLLHAFAGEIIERIACEPVREELDRLVWDRLEQNPHIAEATEMAEA